jgi:hypothetical protein
MTTTLRPLHGAPRPADRLGRYVTYAVCANGRQIGSIALADHSPQGGATGWIENLRIAPERRGRGHGGVAMLIAEEVLRAWGCQRVALTVSAAAPGGLAVARQLGYTVEACTMVKVLSAQPPPLPARAVLRPMRPDEHGAWTAADTADTDEGLSVPPDATGGATGAAAASGRGHGTDGAGDAAGGSEVDTFVLDLAGKPVGVLHLAYAAPDGAPGRGWIHRAAVVSEGRMPGRDPGHRRTLLHAAEHECRKVGLREVGTTVPGTDPALFRLAGSLGYEVRTVRLGKQL